MELQVSFYKVLRFKILNLVSSNFEQFEKNPNFLTSNNFISTRESPVPEVKFKIAI